ncbi:solute carrier family 22 member 2-like isoform X2 [Clavelina lepadiformis]|uniref:solute carrier family 22 member 2-like isoform X2 n=1 Tax=Clavelina lepadiformis TaxID=159417 RepID=UPI004041593E
MCMNWMVKKLPVELKMMSRKTTKLLSPTDPNLSDNISWYIPVEEGADDELRWSRCYMYNNTNEGNSTTNNTIKCNEGWRYFEEPGEFTAGMEFDLVCDKAWVVPLVGTFLMIGLMLGSIMGGYVSDRFGRKVASLAGIVALTVSSLLMAFTPVWIGIHLMTLVQSFSNILRMAFGMVLINEICPNNYRHRISVSNILLSSIGAAFLPLFAFCFRNWRYMTGAIGIVQIFALLPAIFVLEESPRWLCQNGKEKQYKRLLHKAAKVNKNKLNETEMSELENERLRLSDKSGEKDTNKEKLSYLHLIKIPFLRKRIIIFSLAWLSVCSSFYGLSLNANNLKGNRYLLYLGLSGAETPGHILSILTIQKIGCRLTFVIFNTITGFFLLITPLLQSGISDLCKKKHVG